MFDGAAIPVRATSPLPRVAAVILNWRRPEETIDCIESVAALDYDALDIMVCDNDSGDGSFERLTAMLSGRIEAINGDRAAAGRPGFTFAALAVGDAPPRPAPARLWLVQTGRNGGYAFGNNVGIRLALTEPATDYVWLLNNDTVVDRHALSRLVDHAERDPSIGICGATVLHLGARAFVQTLGGGRFLPLRARAQQIGEGLPADAPIDGAAIEDELDYVNGAAALVRRRLIESVGYMDERYFLYWEEMDWATRARGRFRLGYCPGAIVYHSVGAASGSSDLGIATPMASYWMTRSRFRYLRHHRPELLAVAYPLLAKKLLAEIAAGRPARAAKMMRGALCLGPGR